MALELERHDGTTFIDCTKTIAEYVDQEDWRVRANSNASYCHASLINNTAGKAIANYWLDAVYSPEEGAAHREGKYHIHDLDCLTPYCFTGDTRVVLLDGTTPTFTELVEKYGNGEYFWVISRDKNGNIVPGKAHHPRLVKKDAELIKITISGGAEIICTPDHEFMLRDGSYKQAKNLRIRESLMPYYSSVNRYIQVTDAKLGIDDYLHRIVGKWKAGNDLDGKAVHHINGNKLDNRPENIEIMQDSEHRSIEVRKTMLTDTWKKANNARVVEYNKSDEKRKSISKLASDRKRDTAGRFYNHTVIKREILTYKEDVYCLTVDEHENFALKAGVFVHNCAGWNLRKLLDEGFNGVRGRVNSKAPKHLSSALGQMANFLGILQNEWAGAQAFSSFDTFLAPYVFIDKLSYKQVKDAVESFVYNLNVPARFGQSAFTNVTIDWTVPKDLKDQMPTRNGDHLFEGIDDPELVEKAEERGCTALTDLCYKHFLPEMRMLQKAYFEVMTEGDTMGQPFTFPIPTVNITEDFDWDSENIDTLFENTAKRGSSYFQNFVGSQYKRDENGNLVPDEEAYKPDAVRSMCPLTLDTEVVTRTGEEIGYKTMKDLDPETDEVYGLGGNWYKFEKTEVFTGKKVIQFEVYSLWHKEKRIVKMSEDHLQPVTKWQDGGLSYENKPAKDIKEGDFLPGVMQTPVGTGIAEYKVLEKKYLDGTEPVQCISVKDSPDNLFILNCGLITHNCRLQLDLRELQRRGNGLFGSAESTGSTGVVTINLARLGYLHKGDKRGLYKELDQLMDMAKSTLEKKRTKVTELFERGLYPYTKRYLPAGYRNHFSTIGINGMNELIRNYTSDKHNIADEKGKAMALEIIHHMREKMRKYQEETGHLYNLEAAPAEGCMSYDTTVWTDEGFKKIGDLVGRTDVKVFTFNEATGKHELKDVESIYETSSKAQVVKVTLDNGNQFTCTLNHPVMVRRFLGKAKGGELLGEKLEWVEATNLKPGDRLKSVYFKEKDTGHLVFGQKSKIHRIVAEYKYGNIPAGMHVHHVDGNKHNNSVGNITLLTEEEHKRHHLYERQQKGEMKVGTGECNPFFGKTHSVETSMQLSEEKAFYNNEDRANMVDAYVNGNLSFAQIARLYPTLDRIQVKTCIRTMQKAGLVNVELPTRAFPAFNKKTVEYLAPRVSDKEELLAVYGGGKETKKEVADYYDFITEENHKVVKVEYLDQMIPVYNMTVKDNHNYFVSSTGYEKDAVLVHNCCYRFAREDLKRYPDIIQAGYEGHNYYTNSSQLPSSYSDDMFEVLEHQNDLQPLYTGGSVLHMYMGEEVSSPGACKELVKRIVTNYRIPYITITPTFSVCEKHGYITGKHEYCPYCDAELISNYRKEQVENSKNDISQ